MIERILVRRIKHSLRQELQSDITHRGCIADDVASTDEEQVEVLVQLPCSAEVEREVGTATAFFW